MVIYPKVFFLLRWSQGMYVWKPALLRILGIGLLFYLSLVEYSIRDVFFLLAFLVRATAATANLERTTQFFVSGASSPPRDKPSGQPYLGTPRGY